MRDAVVDRVDRSLLAGVRIVYFGWSYGGAFLLKDGAALSRAGTCTV